MKQQNVFPMDNPFSYHWIANCVLYSVVIAFLLNKGWTKLGPKRPWGCDSKQQKGKRVYEEKASELRKISIATAEVERLKENRKLTREGKGTERFCGRNAVRYPCLPLLDIWRGRNRYLGS